MITELSPLLHRVATQVRQQDLVLQKESWVYFTDKWTDTWKWAKGNLFRVADEPIMVRYAASYTLPGSDYKEIDLSNSTGGLQIYPEDEGILYQIALGMKPGRYMLQIDLPYGKYIYHLGYSGMYPDFASATKKYLGQKRPEDSPVEAPTLFLYAIKDGPAFFLKPYVLDDMAYEKVTLEFNINKCRLEQIPSPSAEQIKNARKIPYFTEMVGF
ncbi:MAG: hypothetical protein WC551_07940 [Patescibacteria group bacterium]